MFFFSYISIQTYGCRVIQRALEVMNPEHRLMTARELHHHVPQCVRDQNGNHVIQKCIETMPTRVQFIVSAFHGQIQTLAAHAYGCRVIQRLLEFCRDSPEITPVLDEIVDNVTALCSDQYGNYVVQDLLIHGSSKFRKKVELKLKGCFMEYSRHKFASNVVEKLYQYGTSAERYQLLAELCEDLGPENISPLVCMVKDQFANYVVQKLLDLSDEGQRRAIVMHMRPHTAMLKRYNYAKHIVVRVERFLESEGIPTIDAPPMSANMEPYHTDPTLAHKSYVPNSMYYPHYASYGGLY